MLKDLNTKIDQLLQSVVELRVILQRMKQEYEENQPKLANRESADWIHDALRSLDKNRQALETAVRERDPYNVSFAAGQLVAMNRFLTDVSKDWSRSASALDVAFEKVFAPARDIAFGIKRLDASSLEAARQQLLSRVPK